MVESPLIVLQTGSVNSSEQAQTDVVLFGQSNTVREKQPSTDTNCSSVNQ